MKARWVPKSIGSEKGSIILCSLKFLVEYFFTLDQNLFHFIRIIDAKIIGVLAEGYMGAGCRGCQLCKIVS